MCHSLTWLKTIIPKSMKEDYAQYLNWSSLLKLSLRNNCNLWFRVFGIRPISLNCLGATNEFVKWIYIHAKLINDYTDFRHKTITRCLKLHQNNLESFNYSKLTKCQLRAIVERMCTNCVILTLIQTPASLAGIISALYLCTFF